MWFHISRLFSIFAYYGLEEGIGIMNKFSGTIVVLGFLVSGCVSNGNTLGFGAVGATGGAAVGQLFGKGRGKILATAGGTALGGLIGSFIGNKFDTINSNQSSIIGIQQQQYRQLETSLGGNGGGATNHIYHSGGRGGQAVDMKCVVQQNRVICNSR